MSAQAKFTQLVKEHFGNDPVIGIEIGTASGIWTEHVLRNLPILETLYTIDPYKHFSGEKFEGGRPQDWHNKILQSANRKLDKYSEDKLVRLFKTSEEALIDLDKLNVDFVYIDGNHNEPYVKFDVNNYYPLVKKGGIFAGHDYNLECVQRITNEKFGNKINIIKDVRVWYVYK